MSRPIAFACAVLSATTLAVLPGCNSGDAAAQAAADGDWINTPGPAPTATSAPAPTPTVTPSPAPSSSPVATSSLYTGPAEMEPYVQSFIDDATAQGVDVLPSFTNRPPLTIQIASLSSYGSSVIGLCETGGSMRRVTFEPTFWNNVDETQRMLVAHHELGHCILYRAHRSDLLASGADASIMYPVIFSDATFNANSAYYLNELYTYGVSLAAGTSAMASTSVENSSQVHICNLDEALR